MAVIRIILKEGDTTGEIPDKKTEQDKERANDERLRLQGERAKSMAGWDLPSSAFRKTPP
jgi:hypothetical protein